MKDKKFWKIIDKLKWNEHFDDEKVDKKLRKMIDKEKVSWDELDDFIYLLESKQSQLIESLKDLAKDEDKNIHDIFNLHEDNIENLAYDAIGYGKEKYEELSNSLESFDKFTKETDLDGDEIYESSFYLGVVDLKLEIEASHYGIGN